MNRRDRLHRVCAHTRATRETSFWWDGASKWPGDGKESPSSFIKFQAKNEKPETWAWMDLED